MVVNSLGLVRKVEYFRNDLGIRAYVKLRKHWWGECQGGHPGMSGKLLLEGQGSRQ